MDPSLPQLPRRITDRFPDRNIKFLRSAGLLVPLAGIAASEYALLVGSVEYTLWGHFLTLLFSLGIAYRAREAAQAYASFGLLSTFRLVTLGMPTFVETELLQLVIVHLPFVPVFAMVLRARGASFVFGERLRTVLALPVVAGLGVALAHVEYQIVEPGALISAWTPGQIVLIAVVMTVFVGLVEELLFRGLLQKTLGRHFGRVWGVLLASAAFGLMHSAYGVPQEVLFAGLVGVVLGVVYELTDDLFLVTVFHGVLNVVLFAYVPLQGPLFTI